MVQETPAIWFVFWTRKPRDLPARCNAARSAAGRRTFEHFLEKVTDNPEWLGWLDADPVLAGYVLVLFEHSHYFAEQMIRVPELLLEMKRMREKPNRKPRYEVLVETVEDATDLRRYFRREMFRIQAESICLQVPIFTTLRRTSELADATIAAAYKIAVNHVVNSRPPLHAGYEADGQLMVVALGRWECANSISAPMPTLFSCCRMRTSPNTHSGRALPNA